MVGVKTGTQNEYPRPVDICLSVLSLEADYVGAGSKLKTQVVKV